MVYVVNDDVTGFCSMSRPASSRLSLNRIPSSQGVVAWPILDREVPGLSSHFDRPAQPWGADPDISGARRKKIPRSPHEALRLYALLRRLTLT